MTKRKSPSTLKKPGKKPRKPLTEMQLAAVMAYLDPECPSKPEAIRRGYPKAKNWTNNTLCRFVADFFNKPNIIDEIHRQREKIQRRMRLRYELSAERILDEMRCLGLARAVDVTQYERVVDQWGRVSFRMDMTSFDELPDEAKAAIKKFKIKATKGDVARQYTPAELRAIADEMDAEGTDSVVLTKKLDVQEIEIEMYDKLAALKDLGKYFNLFVEKIEVEHGGSVEHVHSAKEWSALFAEMTQEQRLEYAARRRRELLCEAKEVDDD